MFRGQYVGATKSGSFRRGQNLAHDVLKRDSKRQSRLLNDQGEGERIAGSFDSFYAASDP